MTAPAQPNSFRTANPHALATILEASQTKSIIAARDIFDIAGTKLWARDQPVSQALQRKLMDRQLRQPLESCLMAEDGVTSLTLGHAMHALLARGTPLAALLKPHAARLVAEVPHLPLHPVAQLLLTAAQASRPETFDHAVQAMALNGALMLAHGGSIAELRVAMLCGLLHDLGEMYIDPLYGEADADRALDFQSYQHLVVHPHVGSLLIAQLTNYPPSLSRAVAEHHERLDGSGYPHGLRSEQVSPQGRLLSVTEAALGVLRSRTPELARASVALRVVPGEFDLGWVGRIAEAARHQPGLVATRDPAELGARLAMMDRALQESLNAVEALAADVSSPPMLDALGLTEHLLRRLRTGWYASGLWSTGAVTAQDAPEVEAIEDELLFRLRAIQRAALLRAGDVPPEDAMRLHSLCERMVAPFA
ncbi:MAG: HD domain-containing protein [Burkholderiales bacterium]|nr:HD domain-containing protein [Burkholderiales bacterium]